MPERVPGREAVVRIDGVNIGLYRVPKGYNCSNGHQKPDEYRYPEFLHGRNLPLK